MFSLVLRSLIATEDAVFAEPGPGGGTMMAGAVYTLPAQRNVPLPMAMQRLIPMATQGGKPRSFTLPRDSNLHTLLTPPAKEEQQTRNGEFQARNTREENTWTRARGETAQSSGYMLHCDVCVCVCVGGWMDGCWMLGKSREEEMWLTLNDSHQRPEYKK